MKKLLMFMCVCVVAGLAQAASVTWNYSIGTFYDPDWNPLDNGTIAITIGGVDYGSASIADGAATGTITGDFNGGETISVTLAADFAEGSWTQTISDWTMPSMTGNPTLDNQSLGNVADNIAIAFIGDEGTLPSDPASAGWSSGGGGIPEPTSGLLLLIGASLLGLRRKQK